mgnify:CR=1 FL=1
MRFVRICRIAIVALAPLAAALGAEKAERLNILFILVDDMGYGDLSCCGGTRVSTPRIDELAHEGIRFTQFYVNAPVCSPSRVAFTTGQYPARWKITSYLDTREMDRKRGLADWLSPDAPSLARFLSMAGYHTGHVGKWHLGGQRDVGDAPSIARYGFAASLTNFEGLGERILPVFEPLRDGRPVNHVPTQMNAQLGGRIRRVERHKVTECYVDRAIEEMQTACDARRPFYVNLWLDDVHAPVQAPPGLRGNGSPEANYLGVLREMDRQRGRVFDFIRARPALRANTIILLASDNGPDAGLGSSGGLRGGKANLYEGGVRSPLIVWHPGALAWAPGRVNETTVLAAMDIPPSLLAVADVRVPLTATFDGLNMADVLVGRVAPKRNEPIMWMRPPDRPGPDGNWPDLAIRAGDWKLLVSRDGTRPELFHIVKDPKESVNLADRYPDRVRPLRKQVIEWDRAMREPSH